VIPNGANSTNQPTPASDGFYQGYGGINTPSVVIDPANSSKRNFVVACSYAINGDNDNSMIQTNPPVTGLDAEPCAATGDAMYPPRKLNELAHPSDLAFILDGSGFHLGGNLAFRIMNRHGLRKTGSYGNSQSTGNTNILFFDGHVGTFARKTLPWLVNTSINSDYSLIGNLQQFNADAVQGGFSYPKWRADQ
jgi:prepilin-type processing-associated H-X9-DG protein